MTRLLDALGRRIEGWPLVTLTHIVALLLGVFGCLALNGEKVLALICTACFVALAAAVLMLAEPDDKES